MSAESCHFDITRYRGTYKVIELNESNVVSEASFSSREDAALHIERITGKVVKFVNLDKFNKIINTL
jgi:hypothetical protein